MSVLQLCKLRIQKAQLPGGSRQRTQLARLRHVAALTIIELVVVMMIILILAGLVLGVSSYVQNKGARARAETEIAALSAALESYKADNGIYPQSAVTNSVSPNTSDTTSYTPASQYLYTQLSGDSDGNPTTTSPSDTRNYMGGSLKQNMLSPNPPGASTYIRDPFGNSYGYSTAKASNPSGTTGNNPTFDLWSTANDLNNSPPKWVKNW